MKYALIIAALLNALTVEEAKAITLFTTQGTVAYVSKDESSSSSSSSSDSSSSSSDDEQPAKKSLIQLQGDCDGQFFLPGQHEMIGGGGYERVVPARFATDDDDIFMRSMIKNYALEAKTKECFPSGSFWMDEAAARAASNEVLETNCGKHGQEKADWIASYFGKAWNHFDVNRTGKIEVIKMPQFFRFLCSNQEMYLW